MSDILAWIDDDLMVHFEGSTVVVRAAVCIGQQFSAGVPAVSHKLR